MADSEFAFIDQMEKPVAFWKNALLRGNMRNYLKKKENPINKIVIDLPDKNTKGVCICLQYIMLKALSISLFCICLLIPVSAQTDSTIWITGKIIDSDTFQPVPYANIASYSQLLMYAADSSGHFYIQLPYDDSIKVVVLGYSSKVFKVKPVLLQNNDITLFPLDRVSIMLKNVDINLYRGYFNLDNNSDSLKIGFNASDLNLPSDIILYDKSKDIIPASYKPIFKSKPPAVAFLFHPLSFIHYFTSKSQKSKRKMVKIIYSEKNKGQLTNDLIEEISGFKGEELQQFIIFCNKNIKLCKKDNEALVRQKVFLALENFISKKKP